MILDFHATCGNIPTQGKNWTLANLAFWADLCGIDALVIESADAIIHFDDEPHERLLAACRAQPDRFLAAATISLVSDTHSLHVARSARQRGFACVVLREEIFDESRVLHAILAELRLAPLPIYRSLTSAEFDHVYLLARQYQDLAFVLAPADYRALELNHRLSDLANVYLAMAHTLYCVGQLEKAVRRMGSERILFAGDLPHQHPARPLGVITDAEIEEADQRMVLGGSARKLLAAHGIRVREGEPAIIRRTPPCPVIDTHGHIGQDHWRPDYDASVEAVLRFLERAGGEVLYISSLEAIHGDVVAGNRKVEEAIRVHSDRLRGLLVINPWMGQDCLADIRNCRARGFCGLKPYPRLFGHQLSDPVMEPVLALAEELDLPMLCHSSAEDLRRVLKKRPNFKMLAAHMSFEYEPKAWLAREFPNTYLEISGAGVGLEDIVRAVEIAGEDKLVFGSDVNCHSLNFTMYPLLCSGLPERTIRKILWKNALRLFEVRT